MRYTLETMGTVASIELPDGWEAELRPMRAIFDEIEQRFSLYRPESELSRIASGQLSLSAASDELLASYARALEWRSSTGGSFSPHRPDGVIDLNGIVKAEAIERAGKHLQTVGCPSWSINVGGDILISPTGGAQPTGIVDPADSSALLCAITLGGSLLALATSGSAHRGDHIWRGGSTAPPQFIQVSVAAADIVTADVLATAIVAGGRDALDDITDRWDVDVITVDRAGALRTTQGLLRSLATR
ncbi:FAD:protein FMN transferase [Salinibacterium sp. PAMC 21357]|uniref:FAD:protein FMN transferase n=1 Tax=Salinibacterium sp. PAMC 21357 TaxID=1112215 RepID=UPI0011471EE9|nr:FAD:protein FMN transferase [Salinibacterium sp. PAMC 21357]